MELGYQTSYLRLTWYGNECGIKFFAGSQVSSAKKPMKKAESVRYIQRNYKKLLTMQSHWHQKRLQSSGWDYLTVHISYISHKGCKISNMTVEIVRIHEYSVATASFTLCYWMACWSRWHQIFESDRRNVKRRTECFSDVFLHVCVQERWQVLQKFIDEVHRIRPWSFPLLAAAQQAKRWKKHYPRFRI